MKLDQDKVFANEPSPRAFDLLAKRVVTPTYKEREPI